jgi:hypothetical protein
MLLESTPCNTSLPAVSASSTLPSLPGFHIPTAAESFATMLAAAASFSSLDMLKLLDSANAQSSGFALPASFPFMHPFVAPLLLGVNPLLSQPQFVSAPNFQAFEPLTAPLNPSPFSTQT